jgi:hypothetical protein
VAAQAHFASQWVQQLNVQQVHQDISAKTPQQATQNGGMLQHPLGYSFRNLLDTWLTTLLLRAVRLAGLVLQVLPVVAVVVPVEC